MLTKAEISMIRSLSDKRGRMEQGLFVVEGRKMVGEALSSGFRVDKVYATTELTEEFPGAATVSPREFERISRLKSPQGVLALVALPLYPTPHPLEGELMLALDCVQDPGNLGTIIRIADWFGIRDIMCTPDTADCFNPKTVQATMGSLFRVRVHYGDLTEFLSEALATGLPVFGAFIDGESVYGAGPVSEGVLVMGNEGNGISSAVGQYVTRRLSIPPFPAGGTGAESLNVAVATAIIVSHFRNGGFTFR